MISLPRNILKRRKLLEETMHVFKELPVVDYHASVNHALQIIPSLLRDFPESKNITLGELFEKALIKIIMINTDTKFEKLDVAWEKVLEEIIKEKGKEESILEQNKIIEIEKHVTNNLYERNKVLSEELEIITTGYKKETAKKTKSLMSMFQETIVESTGQIKKLIKK